MALSILLHVDSSRIDAVIAELRSMPVASEFELDGNVFPKAAELFVDGALCIDKLTRIHCDSSAGRAGDALVALEPTDGCLELLAALRACHADARSVEIDGHGSRLS